MISLSEEDVDVVARHATAAVVDLCRALESIDSISVMH